MTAALRVFVLSIAVPPVGMTGALMLCCFPALSGAYGFDLFFAWPVASLVYLIRLRKYTSIGRERAWFVVLTILSSIVTWSILVVMSIPY